MSANGGGYSGYHQAKSYEIDEELACVGPGTPCGRTHAALLASGRHDLGGWRSAPGAQAPRRGFGAVPRQGGPARPGPQALSTPQRLAGIRHRQRAGPALLLPRAGSSTWTGRSWRPPAESDSERLSAHVRLGAYPVREYKGLVFAYLGPPEETPPFPVYDTFEIEGGELVPYEVTIPCNWLQVAENSMDPLHVVFLHTRVNRVQFTEKLGILPIIDWHDYEIGFFYTKGRRVGRLHLDFDQRPDSCRTSPRPARSSRIPRARSRNTSVEAPSPRWIVPVDDTHCTVLAYRHFNPRAEAPRDEWRTPEALEKIDISELRDRPYEERQRNPGDFRGLHRPGVRSPRTSASGSSPRTGAWLCTGRGSKREMRRLREGETAAATRRLRRQSHPDVRQ